MDSQLSLLKTSRFLPLFLVLFFGAFNDNLVKTVVVVLIAYGLWDIGGWDAAVLVAVASGLFILPFVLFCPFAGNLSDKYDKAAMIRWIKATEIGIAVLAIAALFSENLYFALFVLLLLGAQSSFFSPCKLSILPQHLKREELVAGNAWVSTGTYLAILAGTIIGALIAPLEHGKIIASAIIVTAALVGYWAALYVPKAEPPAPDLHLRYNIFARAYEVFRHALDQPSGVFVAIVGVAFFYFVAATFHAQFPNFTKQTLGADNIVLTTFMVTFSVGVAIGAMLNHKLLKGKASGVWVPTACIFMGVFGVDIYFAALAYPKPVDGSLHDIFTFISHFQGTRLLADTFMQSVACGFFVIPLRAIVQDRSNAIVRSRVISSSNMMDAAFILLSSVFSTILLAMDMTIEELYLSVSVITIFVALALFKSSSLRATTGA